MEENKAEDNKEREKDGKREKRNLLLRHDSPSPPFLSVVAKSCLWTIGKAPWTGDQRIAKNL
jgi:hypothetical protein